MNRLVLLFSAVIVVLHVSCQPSKEEIKREFVDACIEGADKEISDTTVRRYLHEYCECSGEKAVNKLTIKEWKEMNTEGKAGRLKLEEKLKPYLQACLDTLELKMDKGSD